MNEGSEQKEGVQKKEIFLSLFDPPESTFEPTKKEPNVSNINTIPGDDVLYFDCRILPQYHIEDTLDAFSDMAKQTEQKMGVQIDIETVMADQAAPPTSPDAPVVKSLINGIKNVSNPVNYVFGNVLDRITQILSEYIDDAKLVSEIVFEISKELERVINYESSKGNKK